MFIDMENLEYMLDNPADKNLYYMHKLTELIQRLNMVEDFEGLEALIPLFLEILCDVVKAESGAFYYTYNKEGEAYLNTYTWVVNQPEQFKKESRKVYAVEKHGSLRMLLDNRTVTIVKSVQEDTKLSDEEKQLLEQRGIHALLLLPLFLSDDLGGSVNLMNPQYALDSLFYEQLVSLGGHLGSVYRYLMQQKKLQETMQRLENESRIMQALCGDYTVVLHCDLLKDTCKVIKNGHELDLYNKKTYRPDIGTYTKWMVFSKEKVIAQEAAEEYANQYAADVLRKRLEENNPLLERYHTIPDRYGQEYFELKVVSTYQDENSYEIIIGFRPIDDILKVEKERQEQLSKALAEANSASEAKSSFLSTMSHDIRTPMNAIIGLATLIDKSAEDSVVVKTYAKQILGSGKQLLGIINNILDMNKIESGKIFVCKKDMQINEVVSQIRTVFDTQAEEDHKQFIVHEDVMHHVFLSDEVHILQILTNVISNAFKYTPEGGKIYFCVAEEVQEEKSFLKFVVKDTGIGMHQKFIDDAFEPFSREESSLTNKVQGTGLGLSITKKLVDMLRGTIHVESEEGKGTCFTIRIPVQVCVQFKEKESREVHNASLAGLHVLCAEDNALNGEILSELLKLDGITGEIYENGKQCVNAFEKSKEGTYDVIFMDIQMPVMNGYEATKQIRNSMHPDAKKIPIIAMSANAFSDDIQASLDAGMDAHISKPVDINKIEKLLLKYAK